MRPSLPSPATPSPGSASAPQQGPRSELVPALALTLVPLVLHARVLFHPPLEVSDGDPGAVAVFPARLLALGLHAGTTLLAFGLARRLGASRTAGALAALLFAVHPLRVEAVAWLSQWGFLLGGSLFLLASYLALGRGAGSAVGGRVAMVLALAVEPRHLLGVPWLRRAEQRRAGRMPTPWGLALDGALALAALAWAFVRAPAESAPDAPGLLTRLLHLPLSLAALAGHWCWPAGLTPYHPHPALADAPPSPWVLASAWLALGVVAWVLLRLESRRAQPSSGAILFVALAAPHALAARGTTLFSEASGYAALFGLELALVFLLEPVLARAPRLVFALGAVAALACAARTEKRLGDWRSEEALARAALAVRPEVRAHDALGRWHFLHGRLGAAQREHERALALAGAARTGVPDALAQLHLGEIELRRALVPGHEAHLGRAAELLEPVVSAFPDWVAANELLGEVYQRAGENQRALGRLEAASAHGARGRTHARLGMVRRELDDLAGARAAFARATELDPRAAEAWCGLGLVALEMDEPDAGRAALERALALEPEHAEPRVALAHLQEARGERAEAERNLRRAVSVNPDSVDGLYALGKLLAATGRADEALRALDRLCDMPRYPPHVRAHLESARLRMARGEVEIPRERLRAVLEFNPEQAEARALLARLPADGDGR